MMHQRHHPALLVALLLIIQTCSARRGAIVRDGMSSKRSFENPMTLTGDITSDPDVVTITTRCSKWSIDPIKCIDSSGLSEEESSIVKEVLSKEMRNTPLHVTFRSLRLAGGKRPNWMRTTAFLGNPAVKSKFSPAVPVRAVWTCSNPDADTSMTYDEDNATGKASRMEIGKNVLEESYEDCMKRVYGKYVELEVLLPRTKSRIAAMGGPPPSLVYRVPIQSGSVNPMGMVSKSRATVTLYPKGRTLAAANASGPNAVNIKRDEAIPLGMSNVHLPLGAGLIDPSWAKGRKVFWKGRSVGLL